MYFVFEKSRLVSVIINELLCLYNAYFKKKLEEKTARSEYLSRNDSKKRLLSHTSL